MRIFTLATQIYPKRRFKSSTTLISIVCRAWHRPRLASPSTRGQNFYTPYFSTFAHAGMIEAGEMDWAVPVLRLFPPHAPSSHAQGSSGVVATVPPVWRGHTKSTTARSGPGPDLAMWLE